MLYPHQPAALLHILEKHLPFALPVYGTLQANASVSLSLYATFPPTAAPTNLWAAVVALPSSNQCRLFCSIEADLQPPIEDEAKQAALAEGQALVNEVAVEMMRLHPEVERVGCVNEIWTEGMRAHLGAPFREICTVFLAPQVEGGVEESGKVVKDGLYLDVGRQGDEHAIYKTSTLRSVEYYVSCLSRTTVLRPTSTSTPEPAAPPPAPVSFILTHADGSLGALYTDPEYRRCGLARWVTNERLRKDKEESEARGTGEGRGWAVVFVGNVASEQLWIGMGWEKAWTVAWVYV